MRWIDEQYLATPFYGSRRMTAELRLTGHQVNRKRVDTSKNWLCFGPNRLLLRLGMRGMGDGGATGIF
jgi:HTH-like domain